MKIAILSRNRHLYSTKRLVEAAEKRGHAVRVIDVLRCYMNIAPHHPEIHYRSEKLEGFDAIIPRIGRERDVLRHRRRAPVRDDGHLFAQ